MLVRDTSQCIVDRLYPAGSQIAIWIKGIEMRMNRRFFPQIFAGNTDTTIRWRTGYGNNIKFTLHGTERLVRKQTFAGTLCILIEYIHFFFCISLCQNSNIYAVFFIATLQYIPVWSNMWYSPFMNQYVIRTHDMFVSSHCFLSRRI